MANEQQDRGAVEASRTPVETALTALSVLFRDNARREWEVAEAQDWRESTARGRATAYDGAANWVDRAIAGHPIPASAFEPVPPSPEAVEPPLTDERCETCGGRGFIRGDYDLGFNNCPSCKPVQEGSERGGEWDSARAVMRAIDSGSKAAVIDALAAHESAISRDAEERVLRRDSRLRITREYQERAYAAEERATQAEGQREALETALREIRALWTRRVTYVHDIRPVFLDVVRLIDAVLSPSTEARQQPPTEDS